MIKFNVDDLIKQGLVKKKTCTEGPYKGLSVLKYARKVFYKNLWHLDDRLLECRGIVVDEEDNIIVRPFKKVFNPGENGTRIDGDHSCLIVRKVNGFMLAVTKTDKYGVIVSTTGTLGSDYAKLGRELLDKYDIKTESMVPGWTYLFEVCDSSDPHIINEEEGLYLIGARSISTGSNLNPIFIKEISNKIGGIYIKPEYNFFKNIPIRNCLHEGYMVLDAEDKQILCKLKSPYYLAMKFISRMSNAKIDFMFLNPNYTKKFVDEEFYDIIDDIIDNYTLDQWKGMSDVKRRVGIERLINNRRVIQNESN